MKRELLKKLSFELPFIRLLISLSSLLARYQIDYCLIISNNSKIFS